MLYFLRFNYKYFKSLLLTITNLIRLYICLFLFIKILFININNNNHNNNNNNNNINGKIITKKKQMIKQDGKH